MKIIKKTGSSDLRMKEKTHWNDYCEGWYNLRLRVVDVTRMDRIKKKQAFVKYVMGSDGLFQAHRPRTVALKSDRGQGRRRPGVGRRRLEVRRLRQFLCQLDCGGELTRDYYYLDKLHAVPSFVRHIKTKTKKGGVPRGRCSHNPRDDDLDKLLTVQVHNLRDKIQYTDKFATPHWGVRIPMRME